MAYSLSNFTYYFSRPSLSSSQEFHRRASPVSVKSLSSLNLRILTGKYLHMEGVLVRAEDKARGSSSSSQLQDPLKFVLAGGTGTLFLVALIVLRIYLGWSYVGDMLLSAVIPYEGSGWYDRQMALGGSCQMALLCCCSPSPSNASQTLSALRFGARAQHIKTSPYASLSEDKTIKTQERNVPNKDEACERILNKLRHKMSFEDVDLLQELLILEGIMFDPNANQFLYKREAKQ